MSFAPKLTICALHPSNRIHGKTLRLYFLIGSFTSGSFPASFFQAHLIIGVPKLFEEFSKIYKPKTGNFDMNQNGISGRIAAIAHLEKPIMKAILSSPLKKFQQIKRC
uniref:Uncharacterized protein n=1 Tax=Ditylenchus dipsaci TaxID=166011 RepID=A0A915CTF4_9BILA